MKTPTGDEGIYGLSEETAIRYFNWIVDVLIGEFGLSVERDIETSDDKKGVVNRALDGLGYRKNLLLKKFGGQYVSNELIGWFEDSERFFLWISNQFVVRGFCATVIVRNPLGLGFRDKTIVLLDRLAVNPREKEWLLDDLRKQWNDRKLGSQWFEWAKEGDEKEKIGFAYRCFAEVRGNRFHDSVEPTTFAEFLTEIDRENMNSHMAKMISDKAKSRWRQQEYRKDKSKRKQLNVLLDVETIKKLDDISRKSNTSYAKIVQILIAQESVQNLYVTEQMVMFVKKNGV